MGMYCCCGVKKKDGWVCECDWNGWYLCFKCENIPDQVPIKKIPDKDGTYQVRTFDQGDYFEEESEFSLVEKNWGQYTNQAISNWSIEYNDNWMGFKGVYAWKENMSENNLKQKGTMKNFIPLRDNLLVKLVKEEQKSGKLLLLDSDQDRLKAAIVVAAGEGKYSFTGQLIPMKVKVGDTILFNKLSTMSYMDKETGDDYLLIAEEFVAGVLI